MQAKSNFATPGAVVFVKGSSDPRDGYFSVVVPLSFWRKQVSDKAEGRFEECSKSGIMVPLWTFGRTHFEPEFNVVFAFSLLSSDQEARKDLRFFGLFTHRDGSRYYATTHRQLEDVYDLIHGKYCLSEHLGGLDVLKPLVIALREEKEAIARKIAAQLELGSR